MEQIIDYARQVARQSVTQFNYSMVGMVYGVDRLKDGLIDVKPLVGKYDVNFEESEYPVLHGVPVIFPSTATTTICFPISQGDTVLLVFNQHNHSEFINGNKETHVPISQGFLELQNAVAFVGFNNMQDSPFDPNNFKNKLSPTSLNIVHNKKTEREVLISFKDTGDISIISPNQVSLEAKSVEVKSDNVSVESKNVQVKSPNVSIDSSQINANNSLVSTDGDVIIKGQSVYTFMSSHTHNYTDDGSPMVTTVPNKG